MIRIAIDGPSSAGKSTVAKQIARDLSIIYVDTGAMYRAIGLYVLRQNLDTKDAAQVCGCLPNIRIATSYDPQAGQRIFLNDEDVSEQIRSPQASMAASDVSAIPQVRVFLLSLQQDMATKQSLIMDGRDMHGGHPGCRVKDFSDRLQPVPRPPQVFRVSPEGTAGGI